MKIEVQEGKLVEIYGNKSEANTSVVIRFSLL